MVADAVGAFGVRATLAARSCVAAAVAASCVGADAGWAGCVRVAISLEGAGCVTPCGAGLYANNNHTMSAPQAAAIAAATGLLNGYLLYVGVPTAR